MPYIQVVVAPGKTPQQGTELRVVDEQKTATVQKVEPSGHITVCFGHKTFRGRCPANEAAVRLYQQ